MNNNEKYISIKKLADLKGVSSRAIRLAKDKYHTSSQHICKQQSCNISASTMEPGSQGRACSLWQTREIIVKGGKSFEILLSSIEPDLQNKYF